MSTAPSIVLERIMPPRLGSVDPSAFPDEEFDLYSISAFDKGEPEVLPGSAIGSAKQIVQPGDVLLSRIVPHIRRAWVVGHDRGRRIIASGEWIAFRGEDVDPRYLRHVLVSDPFHAEFMRTVSGVGGSLLRARPAYVAKIKIPLPPLAEQRRIAEILDKADALRAKRRAALAQLETLTRSIFFEMFGDLAANPKGWPLVDFSSVVYFQEGPGVRNWQFRNAGIKLINVKNIVDGELKIDNTGRYLSADEVRHKYQHFLLDAGDLVVASSGVTWGKIAEVSADHLPLCLNTSMIRLRPRGKCIEKVFIRTFVESQAFRQQILRLITGSAQPNFGPAHLKQVKIPLPRIDLQLGYAKRVAAVEYVRRMQRRSINEFDMLFSSLEHGAFRSELLSEPRIALISQTYGCEWKRS